jgi:hypothetical protein
MGLECCAKKLDDLEPLKEFKTGNDMITGERGVMNSSSGSHKVIKRSLQYSGQIR